LTFIKLRVQCFVYAKQTSKFKFFDAGKQINLLVDPYEIDVLYNNLKDDVFPKQSSFQAWRRTYDHSLAFMQVILETCSPPNSCVLDLIMGTGMIFDLSS
jgi:hypothetical protein